MSQSSGPEPRQTLTPKGRWARIGLLVGSAVVLAGAGATLAGWVFINERLSPILEEELSKTLNRPVKVGDLERLTLSKVRFGPSSLPPTAADPDTASLEALEVQFNLLQLLTRELRFDVHMEQAEVYIEQAADGQWLDIEIERPEPDPKREPFIEVKPGTIRLQNSKVTALPYIPPPADVSENQRPRDADAVTLADVNGRLDFTDAKVENTATGEIDIEAQQLAFDLEGESIRQGRLEVEGTALLPPAPETLPAGAEPIGNQLKLSVRAQELVATDIMPLVRSFNQELPVDVTTGLLSGNATIESSAQEPFTITGAATVKDSTVVVNGLPAPIKELTGQMRFQEQKIAFEDVSAEMGELAARAEGTLDFREGYDLQGQMDPFTVAQVTELFDVELPIETTGNFTADMAMTGPLGEPTVSAELMSQAQATIDQVDLAQLDATVIYQGGSLTLEQLIARPAAGGLLVGSGQYQFGQPGQLTLSATGENLPADAIGQPYGLPEALTVGPVSLEANVSGPVGDLRGLVSWRAPAGDYPARGNVEFAGNTLRFRDTTVVVAGGTVTGGGSLVAGRWRADLQAQGIQLGQLTDNLQGTAAGNAQLAGNLRDPQDISGQGNLDLAIAGGTIDGQINLANDLWQADLQGSRLQLAQLSDNLQGQAAGQVALSGSVNNLSLAGIQGQGQFVVSDGLAAAAPIAPQLAAVREPLTASASWDGAVLTLQQAQTAGIQASGTITPQLSGAGAPGIDNIDLDLLVDNYTLAALPLPPVVNLQGQGSFRGSLTGSPQTLTLAGDARLVDFAVSDLAFESPLSGPVQVALNDGVDINLQGSQQDVIELSYGFDQRRLSFNIRADQAVAQGRSQGDDFNATIANFPLDVLNLPPGGVPGFGTVSGTVEEATIEADLSAPQVEAEFAIINPGLGHINFRGVPEQLNGVEQVNAGRFEGVFSYVDGVAALTRGQLSAGESLYLVNARYSQRTEPQLRGQVTVEQGKIQDVLTTLQIFELSDFGRGIAAPNWAQEYSPEEIKAILDTMAAGNPEGAFLDQLRRVAEILELQDQELAMAQTSVIPPLAALEGNFSGDIKFVGSLPADIAVDFDLEGYDWHWGPNYQVDTVLAEGTFTDGVLQLNPVRLASERLTADAEDNSEAFLNISGAVAFNSDDETRTLSLEAANIPLEPLQAPLQLPTSFGGNLNANATFRGPLNNPQMRGSMTVADATINEEPVESATADFLYQDARFNLDSSLVVASEEDPLTLRASVPYRLPFAEQQAASDQLLVNMRVQDQGLVLLNLLNQQVAFQSGNGNVNLAVRGIWPDGESVPDLASLNLTGEAQLEDVTLTARVLPEPLTDINGSLRFQDDLIIVEGLQGRFSDGEILAQGTFPILVPLDQRAATDVRISQLKQAADDTAPASPTQLRLPTPDQTPINVERQPLVVDLRKIGLNFKGIYNGQVNGRIGLEGSALFYGPTLTGGVVLSRGRLSLPESGVGLEGNGGSGDDALLLTGGGGPPIRFDDFMLSLEAGTRIQVGGVLDVAAQGDIVANGIFPDVEPQGRVALPSGRISLLTTDFRLQGNENYAEFRPNLGFEPYLKATLQTVVPDSTGAGATSLTTASPFPRNEISDANTDQLGLNRSGIETVRIRAEVEGPAFQVAQLKGVTLRSSPTRSEGEIISLISGGVLTALESTLGSVGGEGDNFEGLIALAGTTLLNQVQGILGDTLNISELRLYSATPQSAQGGGTSVDIGGEIGFEVSPDLSISVQKTFTDISPFQFNARYRINNQFTLRGTTSYEDFTENSGLLLEYETRF